MMQTDPSRENRDSRESRIAAPDDHSGSGKARLNGHAPVKRATEPRREVFEKYHFNGLGTGISDPEIYPEYRADGPPSESAHCEVCGQPKPDCTC